MIPFYSRSRDLQGNNTALLAEKNMMNTQVGYGSRDQTYISDGQGVYITRNENTYKYGWFELSDNICYRNGIGGLTVHYTRRTLVQRNIVYNNGQTPREAPSSRQNNAGLTINTATDLVLEGNYVSTSAETSSNTDTWEHRESDTDKAKDDWGLRFKDASLKAGTNGPPNYVCRGKAPEAGDVPLEKICLPSCYNCGDVRDSFAIKNDKYCDTWTYAHKNYCNKNERWRENRYCEASCAKYGAEPYPDRDAPCCADTTSAPASSAAVTSAQATAGLVSTQATTTVATCGGTALAATQCDGQRRWRRWRRRTDSTPP